MKLPGVRPSATELRTRRPWLPLAVIALLALPIVASAGQSAGESPLGSATAVSGSVGISFPIVVNTLNQEVNDDSFCSLQEAIFAANFDDNIAIDPADPTHFIVTACRKGSGDDIIQLPAGAVFQMGDIVADPYNPLGPTATPMVFTNITIEANGSQLERIGSQNIRAFAVGSASVDLSAAGSARVVSGTGELTIKNAYIKGFKAKGGNGAGGGGGGLGAGGAIYLRGGKLTVERMHGLLGSSEPSSG